MRNISIICSLIAILSINCYAQSELLQITRVSHSVKSISIPNNEDVIIRFNVNEACNCRVVFFDQLANQLRVFDIPNANSGPQEIRWDGLNYSGNPTQDEVVLYIIEATTSDGRNAVYNPADQTGGLSMKTLEYTFDRETEKIEYVLPKACKVRIRVGLKDGMFLGNIVDWEPQEAGRHQFIWEGTDSSKIFNVKNRKDLELQMTCYTLPDNTIIVNSRPSQQHISKPADLVNVKREKLWAIKGKDIHYQHDPRICHQPQFSITFPTAQKKDENQVCLSGIVPVRIDIAPEDFIQLVNARFEVMIFVDGIFIHEVEEGMSPFTYQFDTTNLLQGRHVLTVNILGYHDHIGVLSQQLIIGERQ